MGSQGELRDARTQCGGCWRGQLRGQPLRRRYPGKTIASATTRSGKLYKSALVDRGYAGYTRVGSTEIVQPYRKGQSNRNAYQKQKHRKRMNRRAAIEPVIGHLKNDYRMARCYLKGFLGSVMNAHLAAAAWNFRKWIREGSFFAFIARLWRAFYHRSRPDSQDHLPLPPQTSALHAA